MQGHGRIIAPDFCVAHREANSGLSTLNRTKSILSIYHQQRQLQKQRGMCLNDTYPFCQQPLSGNCHSICFSKPVLWTATPGAAFLVWRVCTGGEPPAGRSGAAGAGGAKRRRRRLALRANGCPPGACEEKEKRPLRWGRFYSEKIIRQQRGRQGHSCGRFRCRSCSLPLLCSLRWWQ